MLVFFLRAMFFFRGVLLHTWRNEALDFALRVVNMTSFTLVDLVAGQQQSFMQASSKRHCRNWAESGHIQNREH